MVVTHARPSISAAKSPMGKQSSLFEKLLRRRIQETNGSSTNQLLDGLCEKYPEYRRHKRLVTRMVNQTLKNNGKRKNDEDRCSFNNDNATSRKKAKKINSRQQLLETDQSCEDGEEDISAISSSEDDLTKSMLRNRYKHVELDQLVSTKKVDDSVVKPQKSSGPMFKDIGGMDALLIKLTTDVIFPLYQPAVLATLGVNPMAGILLHGPPGCGKTTLAHAIANEVRVPFYKITGGEIVSGISGMYVAVILVHNILQLYIYIYIYIYYLGVG